MMLLEDGKVLLYVGESFIDVSEEYATEYCSKKSEVCSALVLDAFAIQFKKTAPQDLKAEIATHKEEETSILQRQGQLKKELYARFGDNINLEN